MKTQVLKILTVLLLSLIAFGCSNLPQPKSDSIIFGINLGTSKTEAHKRLNELGKLDREESKQQEIWTLNNYPHYFDPAQPLVKSQVENSSLSGVPGVFFASQAFDEPLSRVEVLAIARMFIRK